MATILKDRTYRLPKEDFPVEYRIFADGYKDLLTNGGAKVSIEPFVMPDTTPENALSGPPSPGGGAGVAMPSQPPVPPGSGASAPGSEQIEEFVKLIGPAGLNLTSDEVDKALARYGVKQFDTLDSKRADMVLAALRKAVEKKKGSK